MNADYLHNAVDSTLALGYHQGVGNAPEMMDQADCGVVAWAGYIIRQAEIGEDIDSVCGGERREEMGCWRRDGWPQSATWAREIRLLKLVSARRKKTKCSVEDRCRVCESGPIWR